MNTITIEMIDLFVFAISFTVLMLLAACSYGRGPQSGKVEVTRPKDKTVDGFGGARGYDYSYSGQSLFGSSRPFPVGLKLEREKTETHKTYSQDNDNQ